MTQQKEAPRLASDRGEGERMVNPLPNLIALAPAEVKPFALRPYQLDAVETIIKGFAESDPQLLTCPTGGGKTIKFAALAKHYQPGRTLILGHREELLEQARDKIFDVTGLVAEIEAAERRASFEAPVVVASVQTMMRQDRRARFPADHFKLIVVDECHYVLAESYQAPSSTI
jgi:superfamily II DNA or RNA helicase